jgi:hypothetical protein
MPIRRLVLLAAVAVLCSSGVAHSGSSGHIPISGKKLLVKDTADPSKRLVVFVSKDPQFLPGNPTIGGTIFEVFNPDSLPDCNFARWTMPASNWREKNGKYLYADDEMLSSPVKRATMKDGLLKVLVKGSAIDLVLIGNGPQGTMGARMQVAGPFWCTNFPGDDGVLKRDDPVKGKFLAVNAERPSACRSPSCL